MGISGEMYGGNTVVKAATMAQGARRCQFAACTVSMILCTLFVGAVPRTSVAAAQERSKAETEAIALARRTLAAKLSVPIERITAVSIAPAQWRDSSLGCPERGMVYTPALTSGYEVRLREADREHIVRVAGARAVICGPSPDPKQPPVTMIAGSLKAAGAVRTALAARLGIDPARVRIVSTRPYRSSTPCPGAPASPKGAAFVVEAEASSQTFRYYTDDTLTHSCDP
jgi:hypothetical protein